MEPIDGILGESAVESVAARQPGTSWARRVLLALCAAHAGALFLFSASAGIGIGFWVLLALNALAIAGLLTRTPGGWVAALLCILVAAVSWTGAGTGLDDQGSLMPILAVAAAVFCVTAPSLRREHGIAG